MEHVDYPGSLDSTKAQRRVLEVESHRAPYVFHGVLDLRLDVHDDGHNRIAF